VTDAKIGDVLSLDLPYFPSANSAQSPVAQRGTDQRKAVILRRTVKPDRIAFLVEDRGLDQVLDCEPEFSLSADATFPKTTVEVEVTNEADLTHPVRVEMAVGALEPAGAGQFVRRWIAEPGRQPVRPAGRVRGLERVGADAVRAERRGRRLHRLAEPRPGRPDPALGSVRGGQ
jgi:hypothetical protein